MNYLALISKAGDNYSGWILDFEGAVMAAGKSLEDVTLRLAQGLVSYAEELGDLPVPRAQDLSGEDTSELKDAQAVWIEPASQNPVSLELARAMTAQGLSGAEVARRMGLPRQVVSRMINPFYWGHSVSSLRRFAEAVGGTLEVRVEVAA